MVTGKLLMEAGSAITADNTIDGGNAGDITITVGTDMTMCGPNGGQPGCAATGIPGALISAQKKSGGATSVVNSVTITVGDKLKATGNFYMEGGVTTYGLETGATIDTTSTTGHAGNITVTAGKTYFTEPGSVVQAGDPLNAATATAQGGKIFLVSDCGLTSQGRVTSKGPDFGADLVHLESCTVLIRGWSSRPARATSPAPRTAATSSTTASPARSCATTRPRRPAASRCGATSSRSTPRPPGPASSMPTSVTAGPRAHPGSTSSPSRSLTVIDGTGNDFERDNFGHTYFSTYAVHANAIDGSDHNPSVVTAKVKNGPLTAGSDGTAGGGRAFEASSTMTNDTGHGTHGLPNDPDPFVGNGSWGGTIDLEASGTVTLDTAFVNASGDFDAIGGHIVVSAWGAGSNLIWRNGDGDVRPIASGTIDLNACGLIDTLGTDFHGEVPTQTHICDATKPDIPVITAANAGPVFKQDLWALCGASSVSGIKFNDLNGNHVRDGSRSSPALAGWEIKIWNARPRPCSWPPDHHCRGRRYSFTVPAGSYVVCETLQAGWTQTAPVAGVACTNGTIGYAVDLTQRRLHRTTDHRQRLRQLQTSATKSGKKFNDVDNSGSFTAGDTPIASWPINLLTTGNVLITTINTAADGTYSFPNLAPGTYRACEGPAGPAGYVQTYPHLGTIPPAGDDPHQHLSRTQRLGLPVHRRRRTTPSPATTSGISQPGGCLKQTAIDIMNNAFPGNTGPDITVKTWLGESVQAAVDGATDVNGDHYIIIMVIAHADGSLGGSANQKVVVSKDYTSVLATNLPFGLFGCSVTLTGGGSDPAVWVKDTAKGKLININGHPTTILVADLHGANSAVGVEADGTNHYLRNEGASNNGTGIKVLGSNNTVHNGAANGNVGDGVYVFGSNNYLTDTNSMGNSGNGFSVRRQPTSF